MVRQAISINDRAYAVQKITNLHAAKHYCRETLFMAVNIMDRYLMSVGYWNFPRLEICLLAMTALTLAAKMKEKLVPSIELTLEFLTEEEREKVDKQAVFDLEAKVLVKLGFDLNFYGPVEPMHRFLHLLGYDKNDLMVNMTFQICKFSLNEPIFLNYRPSVIAACAVILFANIYMRDKEAYESTGVFKYGKRPFKSHDSFFLLSSKFLSNPLLQVNTKIWNNQKVMENTGLTYTALKQCLYELANFIRESLVPDRLHTFDLQSILEADDF